MAQSTTDATFQNDVLNSDIPVLVDFWAPWCGPCRMVGPVIDEISEKMAGKVKVYKLNVDENQQIAAQYRITGIPTVMVFKNGQPVEQIVGAHPEESYMQALAA